MYVTKENLMRDALCIGKGHLTRICVCTFLCLAQVCDVIVRQKMKHEQAKSNLSAFQYVSKEFEQLLEWQNY